MKKPILISSAVLALSLSLGACGGATSGSQPVPGPPVTGNQPAPNPAPTPAPAPSPTPAPAPAPRAQVITGKAVNEQGQPLKGVQVVADNTLAYDSNLVAYTAADGTYTINIGDLATTWQVTAQMNLSYNGQDVAVTLTPDTTEVVAGGPNGGGVRNFSYKAQASTPDNPYGSVGVIHVERGIGQYGVKEDKVTLTIVPAGPLADGSAGQTLVTKPVLSGDGWIVPNMMYGTYTVSATMDGKALKIRQAVPRGDWPEWADSYTGGFNKDFGALKPTMFLELGDGE